MRNLVSTIVTPPRADAVSLSEVKNYARIDTCDDDALLAALITTATSDAEQYLKRSLITQTRKLTLDAGRSAYDHILGEGVYDLPVSILNGCLPDQIELSYGPLQSVSSVVTYTDAGASATFDAANYYTNYASSTLYLKSSASWPTDIRAGNSVEIIYVAGYGDTSTSIPAPIKTAILMHVQKMYDERLVCEMPENCEAMLRRYRIYG